ncbi:TFIIIC sub6 domain containing protein [Asbolus verrucosus]|uniref:TFIIIC sub6 domain containing protein n=1 Tax=Asbolus verrucosus TaxID=1661398 RepID=A0A482W2C3_ASBVE|nr:TFIIIC sub6 domain containing protein [Asbolus verrucosus]
MNDSEEDCSYVYLEFNEKLTPSIFANKMFLRVANLHKPNPLVQINDLVFKGSYDECAGTNLFFEEIEDPPLSTNIFEKDTPIRLKPVVSQTKIIKLKQMKLPKKVSTNKQCKESVILNLNQDYNSVLEKLEQGILNIEDVSSKEVEQPVDEHYEDMNFEQSDDMPPEPEKEIESLLGVVKNKTAASLLEAKYEKLKRLVRRPVKRMKSPELIAECDSEYKDAYEYHNLERQVCQSSDAFRSVSSPIIEKSFVGGVDIDRCVLHGLIPPSVDLNRVLTKEEQNKVFTIDNLENLSIPARYLVLKECVSRTEELIESTSTEELKETDENGRTIKDICDIFRKLVRALEYTMVQTSESDISVKSKIALHERPSDEYVKYKYNPSSDLLLNCPEIFKSDEWTDNEESKEENTKDKKRTDCREMEEESDVSMDDENSDLN